METDRDEKLKDICNTIVMERPEAVGIAYIELDCGCIHFSGVSFNGDPIGKMQTLSGPPDDDTEESPICLQCYREKTLNTVRVTKKGLIWPGDAAEMPERDLRIFIGQTVFGPEYDESD